MKPVWVVWCLIFFSLNSEAIPHRGERAEETVLESSPVVKAIDADSVGGVLSWLRAGHSAHASIQSKLKEYLLDRAISHQSVSVFKLLLSKISEHSSKLKLSDHRGTPELVTLTALAIPGNPQSSKYEAMIEAMVRLRHFDLNEKDKAYIGDGRTALHQASANGNLKMMKLLITRGANVNVKNSSGETPLHLAARGGHLEAVQCLVKAGAKVNEKTIYTKATPLMAAAESGQADVIRMLMRSGAHKEEKDTFGKTAPDRYKEYNQVVSVPSPASDVASESKKR